MNLAIIGCGFVADYYVESIRQHPSLRLVAAMDIVPAHAERFGRHWTVPVFTDLPTLFAEADFGMAIVLTDPASHVAISRACLDAGKHVYCEKPLALTLDDATALAAHAEARGLMLGAAPCNHLGEAVQSIARALADGAIGTPRLAYAEMDDKFLALAPYRQWTSVSGAPWPFANEFAVGCTLEHAAYQITWLCCLFGPVRKLLSFKSLQHPGKDIPAGMVEAADLSVACLSFASGLVARLTCSILAPLDHSLRIIGDAGVLTADDTWFYRSEVSIRRYLRIRRRFMLNPIAQKLKLAATGPDPRRTGAGAMDFARGPADMVLARAEHRPTHMPTDFMLHVTEIMLAIDNADPDGRAYIARTSFAPLRPIQAPIL